MTFHISLPTIFIFAGLLSGCGNDLGCSTDGAKALVAQIEKDQVRKVVGFVDPDKTLVSVDDIITVSTEGNTTSCKAKLNVTLFPRDPKPPDQQIKNTLNVTYEVQKTDDGRLHVTVYGL